MSETVRKSIEYEVTGHRVTDLMSGVTQVLKQEYKDDLKKGARVLKLVCAAIVEEL